MRVEKDITLLALIQYLKISKQNEQLDFYVKEIERKPHLKAIAEIFKKNILNGIMPITKLRFVSVNNIFYYFGNYADIAYIPYILETGFASDGEEADFLLKQISIITIEDITPEELAFEYFVQMKEKNINKYVQEILTDVIIESLNKNKKVDFSNYRRLLFNSFIYYYRQDSIRDIKMDEFLLNLSNTIISNKSNNFVNTILSISEMDLEIIHNDFNLFGKESIFYGFITALSLQEDNNVLDKLSDINVWNLEEFDITNSRIKTGIGYKRSKLSYYTFYRFFSGESDKLEWADCFQKQVY